MSNGQLQPCYQCTSRIWPFLCCCIETVTPALSRACHYQDQPWPSVYHPTHQGHASLEEQTHESWAGWGSRCAVCPCWPSNSELLQDADEPTQRKDRCWRDVGGSETLDWTSAVCSWLLSAWHVLLLQADMSSGCTGDSADSGTFRGVRYIPVWPLPHCTKLISYSYWLRLCTCRRLSF